MPLLHLVLIAVIQGLTEFLPISSSGHLILLPGLTGMEDQGQLIDVAVHVGTLFAVMLYFRQDVAEVIRGLGRLARGKVDTLGARLAIGLIASTGPVMAVGFILHATGLDQMLRSVAVIGWTMLVFGLVLYWADQKGPEAKTITDWRFRDAIAMGLWQAVALIPGTSRSGITITGSRLLGYTREEGARISMLMSIPTIMASGVLLGLDVVEAGDWTLASDAALAAALAFGAALLALAVMMRLTRTISFTPYVIYRVILGIGLLIFAYS
ncbi:MAG: undecaprenyl-diphosphate phosphatase [Rhodobacteraceae bacterium]|nr:undecaprenyl-diphosphate phosphatase [Paracoccaceae bacterium]